MVTIVDYWTIIWLQLWLSLLGDSLGLGLLDDSLGLSLLDDNLVTIVVKLTGR